MLVTITGISVEELISDVLLLTEGDTVLKPMLTLSSRVWVESCSAPSWFWVLPLWLAVKDSVELLWLGSDETLVAPSAGGVIGGVEEANALYCSVLGTVILRGGVEFEGSSAVEEC